MIFRALLLLEVNWTRSLLFQIPIVFFVFVFPLVFSSSSVDHLETLASNQLFRFWSYTLSVFSVEALGSGKNRFNILTLMKHFLGGVSPLYT